MSATIFLILLCMSLCYCQTDVLCIANGAFAFSQQQNWSFGLLTANGQTYMATHSISSSVGESFMQTDIMGAIVMYVIVVDGGGKTYRYRPISPGVPIYNPLVVIRPADFSYPSIGLSVTLGDWRFGVEGIYTQVYKLIE